MGRASNCWSLARCVVFRLGIGSSILVELIRRQKNQYTEDLEDVGHRGLLSAELPILVNILGRLPFGFAINAKKGAMRIATYGMQSLKRYEKQLAVDPENVKPTLLTNEYRLVENGTIPQEQLLRDGEFAAPLL